MAGIGFELKKIYRKEGITRGALGVIYSTLVTIGPMVLVICSILLMYFLLGISSVGYADRELLSTTILYTFIFSVIFTSPFNVILSRYLADKFYSEDYSGILNSYYMGMVFSCGISSIVFLPVGWSLYVRGGVDLPFIIAAYVQWISLVILFFSITYLHATKDYKMIALFFLLGMAVSLILGFFLRYWFWIDVIHSVIYAMATGFFLTSVCCYTYIKRYFYNTLGSYVESLRYFLGYKRLLFANLTYILGLYIHNFVFWTVPGRNFTANTLYSHQAYDMATCLAMFTNISTMISFTVVVETKFHTTYKNYMESVIGGTYRMIIKNKKSMFRTLSQQIAQVFGTQIAITCILYMLFISFGAQWGIDSVTMAIYPVLVVAFLGIFMMYGNLVYLYYFADLTGAVLTGGLFLVVTFIVTLFSKELMPNLWGLGVFVGMLAGWTFSFFRIRWIERNFDTYIFCDYKVIDTMKSSNKGKIVYTNRDGKGAK